MSQNLKTMDLDTLFIELQYAAINVHDVYVSGAPIKFEHQAADILTEICEEVESRGSEANSRYVDLLDAEHPSVRLQAALAARKFVPELAVPVLEDLADGKYGGTIAMNARSTLNGMRKRGLIS